MHEFLCYRKYKFFIECSVVSQVNVNVYTIKKVFEECTIVPRRNRCYLQLFTQKFASNKIGTVFKFHFAWKLPFIFIAVSSKLSAAEVSAISVLFTIKGSDLSLGRSRVSGKKHFHIHSHHAVKIILVGCSEFQIQLIKKKESL